MMDLTALNPLRPHRTRYDVRGKAVLITGAGQGIGLELAKILYGRGAFVAIVDVAETTANAAVEALGPRAMAIVADVRDREAMAVATARVVDRFGHLDVVVANAGVTPKPATVRTMDPRDYDRVMGINLDGCFNTVHPALDHIVAAHGHVVVVSSCASFTPGMAGSPYMMSKAAVEQFGRALRVELAASGASAGVAYFGVVETEMTHAMLDADDLGRAIDALMPWPLNVRVTAEQAATVIADGIARRAARTIAPLSWEPYAMARGAINVVLDSRLAGSAKIKDLLERVERRASAR